MAREEVEAVREAVEAARSTPPVADDATFQDVRSANVGRPTLARTPRGEPAFWIVPFIVKGSACGYARVELSREVSQVGVFGSGPKDRMSWVDATFFEKPPPDMVAAIRSRYPEFEVGAPVFSYDRSPGKWAWRVEVRKKGEVTLTVFITPHGWYEGEPGEGEPEREG